MDKFKKINSINISKRSNANSSNFLDEFLLANIQAQQQQQQQHHQSSNLNTDRVAGKLRFTNGSLFDLINSNVASSTPRNASASQEKYSSLTIPVGGVANNNNNNNTNSKSASSNKQIDFDYLTEKLKQIQKSASSHVSAPTGTSTSNATLNKTSSGLISMPIQSSTNPSVKLSLIKSKKSLFLDDDDHKINTKLRSARKEMQRSISNMDYHHNHNHHYQQVPPPLVQSHYHQSNYARSFNNNNNTSNKPDYNTIKEKMNRSQSQLATYSSNNKSNYHSNHFYDSQPIYEDVLDFDEQHNQISDENLDDLDDALNESPTTSSRRTRSSNNTSNSYKMSKSTHLPVMITDFNINNKNTNNQQIINNNNNNNNYSSSTTRSDSFDSTTSSRSVSSSRSSFNENANQKNTNKTPRQKHRDLSNPHYSNQTNRNFIYAKSPDINGRHAVGASVNVSNSGTYSSHRRSSTTNLSNTPRSIVIRREKSITSQPSLVYAHLNNSHDIKKDNLINQHIIKPANTKQNNSSSNNNNNSKENSSSTTSGVETASKNSTSNVNTNTVSDECCQKQLDLENNITNNTATTVPSAINSNSATTNPTSNSTSTNVYITKINELKNRLFIMEIELENEKKKLVVEKDLKSKLVSELKQRHETEKAAALKALEAKLNADKLYELNKLRETIESEKREELDMNQKSFDSELLSLKLKIRDKSEKCLQLEKMLKEEHNKNSKLYTKSMEVVRKYNNELKLLNETNKIQKDNQSKEKEIYSSNLISTQTQTVQVDPSSYMYKSVNEDSFDEEFIRQKLFNIKSILMQTTISSSSSSMDGQNSSSGNSSSNSNCCLESLVESVESLAKQNKKNFLAFGLEVKQLKEKHEKLLVELKSLKETKLKLESLYKIKCKTDLNKSAQIKKLEINYDCELSKFRNEFNSDLVRYLESKLAFRDNMLLDNINQFNNCLTIINKINASDWLNDGVNGHDAFKGLCNYLNKFKDTLKGLIESNLSNLNNFLNNNKNTNLNLNRIDAKKTPINLLFNGLNSDLKQFAEHNLNNKENQFQTHHFKLQENLKQFDLASLKIDDTNRKFQEEINKLDKELNTASSHHSNSSSLNNKNVFNNVNNKMEKGEIDGIKLNKLDSNNIDNNNNNNSATAASLSLRNNVNNNVGTLLTANNSSSIELTSSHSFMEIEETGKVADFRIENDYDNFDNDDLILEEANVNNKNSNIDRKNEATNNNDDINDDDDDLDKYASNNNDLIKTSSPNPIQQHILNDCIKSSKHQIEQQQKLHQLVVTETNGLNNSLSTVDLANNNSNKHNSQHQQQQQQSNKNDTTKSNFIVCT